MIIHSPFWMKRNRSKRQLYSDDMLSEFYMNPDLTLMLNKASDLIQMAVYEDAEEIF